MMQPLRLSPGLAFVSVTTDAPASLSEMTTVPASKRLPPLAVVLEKAPYVPMPATRARMPAMIVEIRRARVRPISCPPHRRLEREIQFLDRALELGGHAGRQPRAHRERRGLAGN